ncbi:stage V sporulation protein B [Cohnella sp. WQ 127256]|uniref:stage V sporulation protein B n=1 Tax=Cohnella sp. WQ 127256 TaxID=2938790 RepID=UPI002740CB62|nr:stage V sporulation protein B [Cohnella sp. WQ 127256]
MSLRKQSFIQGAMILLAAGLLNRILGFVPRIALPRMIGAEGVGLIQLVYPFTIVLLTLIAGGIPLAVAKMVAEADSKDEQHLVSKILRVSVILSMTISLIAAAVCFVLSEFIATKIMTDPRVHTAFLMMIPVLPLVALSSVWRGYFQGKQNMIPTALSQTSETVFRIVLTLLFVWMFLPYGLELAAAGAVLGMVAGECAGLIVLGIQFLMERRKPLQFTPAIASNPKERLALPSIRHKPILRELLNTAIPVTGSKMIGSLSYLLESILTVRSLTIAGIAAAGATAQYGALQGMVIPLLLLPGALTYSLAVSLVPSLSEAASRGDWATIHLRLHQSMRLAIVTGAPFVVLMGLLAGPICTLLYGNDSMAGMLRWLAPIAVFLYMQAPLQAALQALNRPGTALFNTFAGAAIKLILIVQLATNPQYGITGVVIAIGVNMILVTLLHWISVARLTGFRMHPLDFLKVTIAMIVMSAAALWIWNVNLMGQNILNLFLASFVATVIYLLLLILLKLIDRHDAARVPIIGRFFLPK